MALPSSPRIRPLTLLVLALLAGPPAAVGLGQEPLPGAASDPPALRIPPQSLDADEERGEDAEKVPEVVEGGAVDRIRETLQGDSGPRATGDPILDGVLDLLRSRGSVLEGSALDPSAESPEPPPQKLQRMPEGLWVPAIDGEGAPQLERDTRAGDRRGGGTANDDGRFLLAEQLLKTARLLAAESPIDAQRQRLIDDLRREATRSLTREPIPAPQPLPPQNRIPIPAGHSESF